MSNHKTLEFEASCDPYGQYVCHSYREVDPVKDDYSEHNASDTASQKYGHFQQDNYEQNRGSKNADDIFAQSYQSNFTQGNDDYINNMREQFSQMRQSMLDQMETFTYVQNIKK